LLRPANPDYILPQSVVGNELSFCLKLRVDDVVQEPSSGEDLQSTISLWLMRAAERKRLAWVSREQVRVLRNQLKQAARRETSLFWEQANDIFQGFPKLNTTIEEPEEGRTVGANYTVVKRVNRGGFGSVYLVKDVVDGSASALKAVGKTGLSKYSQVQQLACEITTLERLRHPNIVAYRGAAQSCEHILLLTEFVGFKNMYDLLKAQQGGSGRCQGLHLSEARPLFRQVVEAVAYCHRNSLAHRDLKPENIVIAQDGKTAKLVDFGMADSVNAPWSLHGTLPFMPPEVLCQDRANYSPMAADIWSLGSVLMEMSCGLNTLPRKLGWRPPMQPSMEMGEELSAFLQADGLLADILEAPLEREPHRGLEFCSLMHGMLGFHPSRRWTSSAIATFSWVQVD